VPDGLPFVWQGCEISTGPLVFDLNDSTGTSGGIMDYRRGMVSAEFHVRLRFPQLTEVLDADGLGEEMKAPVYAILRAEGEIRPDDHSFDGGLRGSCDVLPHALLPGEGVSMEVLPGL
jgi:hypothetical protein